MLIGLNKAELKTKGEPLNDKRNNFRKQKELGMILINNNNSNY